MPYCVRCGVELQKDYKACPLCQTEVILPSDEEPGQGIISFPDHMPRRSRPTLNLVPSHAFMVLMTFLIVVPILVTFFIDFTNNRGVTWSFYPMASLALLWVLIVYPAKLRGHTLLQVITIDFFAIILFLISMDLYSGPFPEWAQYPVLSLTLIWIYLASLMIFTWHNPLPIIGLWFSGTCGFLIVMDKMTGGADWFLPLALPILLMAALIGVLGIVLAKIARKKPLLSAGLSLFAVAIFITGIDGVVNHYLGQYFDLTWSPILLAVLIPTAIFLIVVDGNPDLKAYLNKKFHL